tara:strand:- start:9564 stop:10205 length:642 start_codon:yes stop_codon:yes gene_type:complete
MSRRFHPYRTIKAINKESDYLKLIKNEIESRVYSRNNHIYFLTQVNKDTVYALDKEINTLNKRFEDIQKKNEEFIITPKPIYLHLNTNGGDIQSGWAAVTFIQNSKIPIHTVIEGGCASAGTIMSVVGTKRYMAKYARMLIHQLSADTYGNFAQLEDEMKYLKEDMKESVDFYHKYSRMSKNEIKEQLKHDHWWDFKTAQKYGFIDEEWKGDK